MTYRWIYFALIYGMLALSAACNSKVSLPVETSPTGESVARDAYTDVPQQSHVGLRNAHNLAEFYSVTTGIHPARTASVTPTYDGLKARLSDGHAGSAISLQANMDLSLSVCKAARAVEEGTTPAQRRLFPQVNFAQAPTKITQVLAGSIVDTLARRFTGAEPSMAEHEAGVTSLQDLISAAPTDTRLVAELICAVMATSALSAVGHH